MTLIEAQRGKAYWRLRVTVAERDALKARVAELEAVLVSRHGGEPVELLRELDGARAERDEWKARATEAAASAERMRALAPREAADTDAPVSRVGPETSDPPR